MHASYISDACTEAKVRRVCETHGIEVSDSFADTLEDGITEEPQTMMRGLYMNKASALVSYCCEDQLIKRLGF